MRGLRGIQALEGAMITGLRVRRRFSKRDLSGLWGLGKLEQKFSQCDS